MRPERVVHLLAPPFEQRIAGHHDDRRASGQQPLHDETRGDQPQLVDVPHC